MTEKRFVVSMSPHVRNGRTIRSLVYATIGALVPAAAWGVYQFGFPAALLILVGVASAVLTELIVSKIARLPIKVGDGHAILVGLLLALLLPAGCPVWVVGIGAALGVLVGKMTFGPLGGSPISPVLVGLLIVILSWPQEVSSFVQPTLLPEGAPAEALRADDAAPAEDPQAAVFADPSDVADYAMGDLFLGKQAGAIGTISPLLLLLGGLFLIWRRAARWQGPVGYILGVVLTAGISHAVDPGQYPDCAFQLFTGATMLGAFFLCTEWSTTPVAPKGLFFFGVFAGFLTILFRLTGMSFGSVAYAIAIASLATPLFDRLAMVPFGKVVDHA